MKGKTRIESFALVYLSMLLFFLVSLHWLSVFGWYAWVAAALYEALFPAVWGFLVSPFLTSGRVSFLKILFPPLSFTAMEAIRNWGPLGMPWGDLGYTQWSFLPIIQMVSITGTLGLTFIIVLINVLLYYAYQKKRWQFVVMALFFFIVPLLYGLNKMHGNEYSQSLPIAVIQTNDLQTLKWDPANFQPVHQKLIKLLDQAKRGNPRLIVFPETALAGSLTDDFRLQKLLKTLGGSSGTYLAIGAILRSGAKPQNGIVLVDPKGQWNQSYSKVRLVPFGEYLPLLFQPLRGKWHALDPIVDFEPGKDFTLFHFSGYSFGSMICFESSFGWIARRLTLAGGEFLVVATNDAWFFNTSAQKMHAIMAVFRSVETGRSCVQSGNGGISLMSDPHGKILAWEEPGRSAVLAGAIPLTASLTGYDRIGDLFPNLCVVWSCLVLLLRIRKKTET